MKYRALTVAREFGSGGGRIANTIAGWLGWKLLDNELISAIARAARVDSKIGAPLRRARGLVAAAIERGGGARRGHGGGAAI